MNLRFQILPNQSLLLSLLFEHAYLSDNDKLKARVESANYTPLDFSCTPITPRIATLIHQNYSIRNSKSFLRRISRTFDPPAPSRFVRPLIQFFLSAQLFCSCHSQATKLESRSNQIAWKRLFGAFQFGDRQSINFSQRVLENQSGLGEKVA